MRIGYLINQYPATSHTFIRREIAALERLGCEVVRISLRGWNNPLADEEDRIERKRTRYVLQGRGPLLWAAARMLFVRPARLLRVLGMAWRLSRSSERPFYVHLIYVVEACRIERWLRAFGVDHLHAHFATNSAEVAMFVGTLGGLPWSFTVHGPEEFDMAPLLGLAEKVRRSSFVVTVSSYGRAQLCRMTEPQYWDKVRVIHCGLDDAFLASPLGNDGPPPPRVVCVGRLSPQKGHLVLLDAVHRLAEVGVDFQVVLVGDGELRPQIEAFIAQNRLTGGVRIAGWLGGAQVRKEILGARALVLPSFAEGLPLVLMEAMALRRPVISTFVGGIPELVRPGKEGWLVPAGDAPALAAAIRDCLEASPEAIARMGDSARERVRVRHDVNVEAAKLKRLFETASLSDQVQ